MNIERYDRRVEKTREAIINSFKEMIIEKDFKDITIKDLAIKANINRKTFYLHYQSMDELLYDLTLDLSDSLYQKLNDNGFFESASVDCELLVKAIENQLNNDYELTKKIISANSYHFFSVNIKDLLKESFIRKLKKKVSMDEYMMNLVGDYIASGMAKVLKDWFFDPGNLTSNDIASICVSLIVGSLKGISNKNGEIN